MKQSIVEEGYTMNPIIAKLCKERWNSLHNDFKHTADYETTTNIVPLLQTKHSIMGSKVHAKDLNQQYYEMMEEFLSNRLGFEDVGRKSMS